MLIITVESSQTVWYKVSIKLEVTFYLMVYRWNISSQFYNCSEAHIDMFVKFIDIQRSISFKLGLDEDFLEFWRTNIMFQNLHPNYLLIFTTFNWWNFPVGADHCGRILKPFCSHIV